MKKTLVIWNGMENEQVSGGDIYTKKLIETLGKNTTIILSQNAKNIIENKNLLFVTDNKKVNRNFEMIWLYFLRIINSIKFLKKENKNFDLTLSSSPFIYDLIPGIIAKTGKRAVILFHILPLRKSGDLGTKVRFTLARLEQCVSFFLIKHFYDIIVAGNIEVQNELKIRFPNKKIVLTNAGIETKKIDSVKTYKKESNLGVFVGRLTVQKGILDLVEIVKTIQKERPQFRLILIGDGPDKNKLLKKIEKENVKSIIIKGFISEKEKYELLKKAKFFVFPSYEEGWGIALAEAIYCNCLCFCYELPHYRRIFGDFPFYIPLGDYAKFSKMIRLNYTRMPKNGQKNSVKRYDYDAIIKDAINKISL